MPTTTTDLDRARGLASAAHVAAVVAAVLIALSAVASHILPAVQELAGDAPFPENLDAALRALIPLLPSVLMISAVWRLRMALEHYTDGAFFIEKPARHIAGAGRDMIAALVAMALIVPMIEFWVSGGHGGFVFRLEPYMVGMFAFALFVMIVGRILAVAAAIKAENDEIV